MTIDYKKYFEILLDASGLINSSFDLNLALNRIIEVVCKSIDCEAASLFLLDQKTEQLYFKAVSGDVSDKLRGVTIKLGEGIAGWVAQNRKSLLVPDVDKDPRHKKDIDKSSGFVTRSIIAVPIEYQGNVLGTLEVLNPKPKAWFDSDDLVLTQALASQVAIALRYCDGYFKLNQENIELKKVIGLEHKIVGQSIAINETLQLITKIAPFDVTVLITGDSGTGKELVANAIHDNSPRRAKPFVAVNCTALPENLIESELFGHEKGAFTGAVSARKGKFESASSGTLFLDEIGDMGLAMQAKILRVLESGVYERVGSDKPVKANVRIVTATNKNLKELVDQGKFREDLYYRLNEINICLAPLKNRKTDIPLLVNHFINLFSSSFNKNVTAVAKDALDIFKEYDWPGNIRELKNVIKVSVVLSDSGIIEFKDLPDEIKSFHFKPKQALSVERALSVDGKTGGDISSIYPEHIKSNVPESLDDLEKQYIIKVLKENSWKKSATAQALKISRPTLDAKIKSYGIEIEK